MNKQFGRELKGVYIRDCKNNPRHRQIMGLFKHSAYELGLTQAELLSLLYIKSIKEVKNEIDQSKCSGG